MLQNKKLLKNKLAPYKTQRLTGGKSEMQRWQIQQETHTK